MKIVGSRVLPDGFRAQALRVQRLNWGTPIQTPLYYVPYHEDPQIWETPRSNFLKRGDP